MGNYSDIDSAMQEVLRILTSKEKDVVDTFRDIVLKGEAIAKKECPVDEGALRADIHSDVEESKTMIEGVIGNKIKYAPYVHNGTGIYAVEGDGRKTPWKYNVPAGKYKGWHITKGKKANPYLKRTLEKLKKIFPEEMASSIRGGMKQ